MVIAQIGEGQEQRRTRADDDLCGPARHRPPRGAALRRAQIAVPRHGRAAEARLKPRQPRCRQRDFGEQHQRLPATAQRRGNGFEIHLGLARSGDTVEHERAERPRLNCRDERRCRIGLRGLEDWRGEIRVWAGRVGVGGDGLGDQRPGTDQAANYPFGHPGDPRQFADRSALPLQRAKRRIACRGQPRRGGTPRAIFDKRLTWFECRWRRQHHAHDRAQGRQIIIRHPFAQSPERRGQRRRIGLAADRAQLACIDVAVRRQCIVPHHAKDAARPQRHTDDIAGNKRQPFRNGIVERTENRLEHDDTDTGRVHRSDISTGGSAAYPDPKKRCAPIKQKPPVWPSPAPAALFCFRNDLGRFACWVSTIMTE